MGESPDRWFRGGWVALTCCVMVGCAHLRPSPCADAEAYLEFSAQLRAAQTESERERLVQDAESKLPRRTDFDRDLIHAIVEAQTGDVAAARAALDALPATRTVCPATSELIVLYRAYLDRLALLAQLAEANRKIEALTDVERTMMKHDTNTNEGGGR